MQKEAMLSLRSTYFLLTNENVLNLFARGANGVVFLLCSLIIELYKLGEILNS